jgi:hypothetical protein
MARPSFQPTDDARRFVKTMAGYGLRQQDMAAVLGIRSPKTLRKHFRAELDRGGLEANLQVAQTLFQKAISGNTRAAIFWLRIRAHWIVPPKT